LDSGATEAICLAPFLPENNDLAYLVRVAMGKYFPLFAQRSATSLRDPKNDPGSDFRDYDSPAVVFGLFGLVAAGERLLVALVISLPTAIAFLSGNHSGRSLTDVCRDRVFKDLPYLMPKLVQFISLCTRECEKYFSLFCEMVYGTELLPMQLDNVSC
jgi:hypothetical protein